MQTIPRNSLAPYPDVPTAIQRIKRAQRRKLLPRWMTRSVRNYIREHGVKDGIGAFVEHVVVSINKPGEQLISSTMRNQLLQLDGIVRGKYRGMGER